uniref:BTB domain-containing protein n=1 Tax=Panagrolaimus sp. JU765 TaxID=591449 RepID=A0AC34PYP4_9BILA
MLVVKSILDDLIEKGGAGDFVILAENRQIRINKELLTIHSPVFDAMLKSDCVEAKKNEVTIKDFSYDVVKTVIKTIYHEKPPQDATIDVMEDVCRFVDKYDMKTIK